MVFDATGPAEFEQSLVRGNRAWAGGGIVNIGSRLQIRNSTLSENIAQTAGGGLLTMLDAARTDVTFSTVTRNHVGDRIEGFSRIYGGGGLYIWGRSRITLGNSIVARNVDRHDPFDLPVDADRAPDCKLDAGGVLFSAGNNVIGDGDACPRGRMPARAIDHDRVGMRLDPIDPRLADLADDGGPTLTHALLRNSPAIDFARFHVPGFFAAPSYDQRGFDRPGRFGGYRNVSDAGAYEAGTAPGITIPSDPPVLPDEVIAGTRHDLVLTLPAARAFNRPLTVRAQEKDLRVSELLRTTSASAIVRVEVDEQAPIGPRSLLVELGEDTFEVPIAVVIAPELPESVAVEIMPGTCPNSLTPRAERTLRAALRGSKEFDPGEIDPASVRLEGVAPVSHRLVDVAAPVLAEKPSCPEGVDKTLDLVLEFDRAEVLRAAGVVVPGFELSLELTAALKDGTPIRGHDAVVLAEQPLKSDREVAP